MNSIARIVILLAVALVCGSTVCLAEAGVPSDTEVAFACLVTNDINAFASALQRHQWRAPVIHSKWFVDRLREDAVRRSETVCRDFGRELTLRATLLAASICTCTNMQAVEAQSRTAVTVASWLSEARGYGNAYLAARYNDIAAVGVIRLTADLSYPTNKVCAIVEMLDTSLDTPEARAHILNSEIGEQVFEPGEGTPTEQDERIYMTWRSGSALYHAQKDPEYAAMVTNSLRVDTAALRSNVTFFAETTPPVEGEPYTLERIWDAKAHQYIAAGLTTSNTKIAPSFLLFRERIGEFPVKPVSQRYSTTDDRLHYGFRDAWAQYAVTHTNDWGADPSSAAGVAFLRLMQHRLVDQDMQEEKRHQR